LRKKQTQIGVTRLEQDNNSAKEKKWQQITEEQRYKIEGFIESRMTNASIAMLIGVSSRTIRREIAMGQVMQLDSELREKRVYKADYAQMKREEHGAKVGYAHNPK